MYSMSKEVIKIYSLIYMFSSTQDIIYKDNISQHLHYYELTHPEDFKISHMLAESIGEELITEYLVLFGNHNE